MAIINLQEYPILAINYRTIESSIGTLRFPVIKFDIEFNNVDYYYFNINTPRRTDIAIEGSTVARRIERTVIAQVGEDFSIPLGYTSLEFDFQRVQLSNSWYYEYYMHYPDVSTHFGSLEVAEDGGNNWYDNLVALFALMLIQDKNDTPYLVNDPRLSKQDGLQGSDDPSSGRAGYFSGVIGQTLRFSFLGHETAWAHYGNLIMENSKGGGNLPDPYSGIPESDSTDPEGTGSFDFSSDPVPMSTLPTISAADTGFTRIYIPTLAQIQSLAEYLWTDNTMLTTVWNHIKQFFENPMDAFVGFNLVPCPVQSGGVEEFRVLFIGTGVQLTTAANQFVDVDCGTFRLTETFGSALDYSPYTKVHAYLPYIGQVDLNVDEIMNRTLQIIYRIDIVTGSCVANILVDSTVMYQFSGHCAINIPFTSADFSNYVSAIISIAKTAVALAVGNSAGVSVGETASTEIGSDGLQLVGKVVKERTNNSVMQEVTTTKKYEMPDNHANTYFAGLKPGMIANTVGQVMASKPNIQHAGSFTGNSGYLSVRRPYLIIERPNLANPAEYGDLNGRPSMITMELTDITGFTRIQQIKLTGCSATQNEQSEILRMLKEGVFF